MTLPFAPLALGLVAAFCFATGVLAQQPSRNPDNRPIVVRSDAPAAERAVAAAALIAKARRDGWVRVIIGLRMTLRQQDAMSPFQAAAQAQALRTAQDSVAVRTYAGAVPDNAISHFKFVPALSLWVNAAQAQRLLSDLRVLRIQEDIPARRGATAMSWPLRVVNAPKVWSAGFNGKAMTVAILDDGVAYSKDSPNLTHPMLANKVVSEACYSAHPPDPPPPGRFKSLCWNDKKEDIGTGAAFNCPKCDHGTGVAAIAAGRSSQGVAPILEGIAPAAKIIAIQIFTKATENGKTDLVAFQSDVLSGLERVFQLRSRFDIAAVNLSIELDVDDQPCDNFNPDVTSAVNDLHQANIATVSIAGNEGYNDAISWPGCISKVIAVGATDQDDLLWVDSNSTDLVKLLAPGADLKVAIPPQSYSKQPHSGTSFAAPHVTGAFALLKGIKPDKGDRGVDQMLEALQCTGQPVLLPSGITRPRIDIWAAYQYLRNNYLDITPKPNYQVGDWSTYRILENARQIEFTITREDTAEAQTIFTKLSLPDVYGGKLDRKTLKLSPGQASQTVTLTWKDNGNPDLWGTTRGLLSFYPTEELAQRDQCPIGMASFEIVDDDFEIHAQQQEVTQGDKVAIIVDRGLWDWGSVTGTVITTNSEGFTNAGDYIPLDQVVSFVDGNQQPKTLYIQTIAHGLSAAKTFGVVVKNARGWVTGRTTFVIRP